MRSFDFAVFTRIVKHPASTSRKASVTFMQSVISSAEELCTSPVVQIHAMLDRASVLSSRTLELLTFLGSQKRSCPPRTLRTMTSNQVSNMIFYIHNSTQIPPGISVELVEKAQPVSWASTLSAKFVNPGIDVTNSDMFLHGKSARLSNGEHVRLGSMAVVRDKRGQFRFGRIEELLIRRTSRRVLGALVLWKRAGWPVAPYRFAQVVDDTSDASSLVPVTVSVQFALCCKRNSHDLDRISNAGFTSYTTVQNMAVHHRRLGHADRSANSSIISAGRFNIWEAATCSIMLR
jgi:hypothetical protein